MATYSGFPANDTASEGETIIVDVTFWGVFKPKGHRMFIERIDPGERVIQSRESGNGIRRWDHTLSISPAEALVIWHDTIVFDAGWRTPFIARFAAFVYTRRHRYRKAISVRQRLNTV